MRLSFRLYFQKNTLFEPNYRQYFLSLFKEAFIQSSDDGEEFFQKFYNINTSKPFTFSVYMPCKKVGEKLKLDGEYINLFFSTNNYEFLMRLYNGILNISKSKNLFTLGENRIEKISNINLLKEVKIKSDSAFFKTLSPFLIRDLDDGSKYLVPEFCETNKEFSLMKKVSKEKFIEAFKVSLKSLVQNFLNDYKENLQTNDSLDSEKNEKDDDEIKIFFDDSSIFMVPVVHGSKNQKTHEKFTINYPAIKGQIKIEAKPEILQLFYDIGIGARRSEGFGMLEVVESGAK
jgi:CRISPR-associated endoribonuclease Cas6